MFCPNHMIIIHWCLTRRFVLNGLSLCNIRHTWLLAWPIVPSIWDKILELVNCERDMGLVSFIKDILMRYIMISSKIVRLRKISRLNLSWFVRKVLLVHIIVSQYQHCYWHSAVYDEARFLTSYINYLDTVQKERFAHLYKW